MVHIRFFYFLDVCYTRPNVLHRIGNVTALVEGASLSAKHKALEEQKLLAEKTIAEQKMHRAAAYIL